MAGAPNEGGERSQADEAGPQAQAGRGCGRSQQRTGPWVRRLLNLTRGPGSGSTAGAPSARGRYLRLHLRFSEN